MFHNDFCVCNRIFSRLANFRHLRNCEFLKMLIYLDKEKVADSWDAPVQTVEREESVAHSQNDHPSIQLG